jgi:rod shape-determining protein MreB
MHRGIHLAGGGALIKGFAKVLEQEIKIPVYIADDPLTCVVRGTGIILEKLEKFREILIVDENDISNKSY